MPIPLAPKVTRGRDRPRADDWNQIVEAVLELQRAVFGAGGSGGVAGVLAGLESIIGGKAGGGGTLAMLLSALAPNDFVLVKITAVQAGGTPIDGAYLPSLVTYSFAGIYKKGVTGTAVAPVYGREVANDQARVYPASVGMTAVIVRTPKGVGGGKKGELMLLPGSEKVARRQCGAGALRAPTPTDEEIVAEKLAKDIVPPPLPPVEPETATPRGPKVGPDGFVPQPDVPAFGGPGGGGGFQAEASVPPGNEA